MTMKVYDELLAWVSELGSGSYDDFKAAWTWLAEDVAGRADERAKAWMVLSDFAALGHLEVAWGEHPRWCAAPPVLTSIPRSGGRVLVTGARTRKLLAVHGNGLTGELEDVAADEELWLDRVNSHAREAGPTTILLACEQDRDAERVAGRLGIQWTFSVPERLSRVLPSLSSWERTWVRGELPSGFEVECFNPDPAQLRWRETADVSQYGLYRSKTYSQDVHALLGPTGWWRVPREQAVYEVLRWERTHVLRYDARTMELSVPVRAPLPALQARCAVLCSGLLPRNQYPRGQPPLRTYPNVDPQIASRIAASLAQELLTTNA